MHFVYIRQRGSAQESFLQQALIIGQTNERLGMRLRVGQQYDRAVLDQALKDLAATELFKDFQITDNNGALTIQVAENPVINRVILEGNKRLKEDKIRPEIKKVGSASCRERRRQYV